MIHQGIALNAAEYYGIPLATMHFLPSRVNSRVIPILSPRLNRSVISALWWVHWRVDQKSRGSATTRAWYGQGVLILDFANSERPLTRDPSL
ncbi:putative glycosyltransferase domain protein [Mycobacterium ulcerans str. Harvey]|uniref:Glycosyltransferase domain protein n=1 Tax=Mycobacterium ulcerans str. Harvey TaxID=1299332 RepID=A0ABN0RAP7_MYCUL|nr:putative glycosyltransferase domain protein [Mycobacterium ulcerans str. Harvey]